MTLPGDWAPPAFSSRGPSPHNSLERNDIDASQGLMGLRPSSRTQSEMAAPILHSSNESSRLGSGHPTHPFAGDRRDAESNPQELEGAQEPIEPNGGDQSRNPVSTRSYRHPLPQPRPFDGQGERTIAQFFKVYEKYSRSMWGDHRSDWVAGLEVHLKGWALTLYNKLINQGKSYEDIKLSLQNAFPGVVDPFKTKNLIKLLNLKRESDEPLPVFFMRVDTLIRETYPHLEEHSAKIQCRDTFLMKLDAETASKIANYCNTRNNFNPETVREACAIVGSPDFLHPGGEATSGADIFLIQPSQQPKVAVQQNTPKEMEMRCLLCAGLWHPISACIIYQQVFSCPLCREDPHPITQCRLYSDWRNIRQSMSQTNNRQWGEGHEIDRSRNVNRYESRGNFNQRYDRTRSNQNRAPYPGPRPRSASRDVRDNSNDRRQQIGDFNRRPIDNDNRQQMGDFNRRNVDINRRQNSNFTERLPAFSHPFRYTRETNRPNQGN